MKEVGKTNLFVNNQTNIETGKDENNSSSPVF